MAAAQQELEDLVLKVTLNNAHRFMVVVAKNSSVLDLKAEISKVSRLFSSTDLGEITSVQSCCNHELPNIYKVGRLLKEGDSVQAYTADHVSNYAGSAVDENAATLESSSQHSQKGSATQNGHSNKNKSAFTGISKDSHQETRINKTDDMVVSHDDEQECTSKRNENEDLDKTINACKDSGSRKGKSRLKTPDFEPVTSGNAEEECSNKRRKKSSGYTEEKSSSQVQEFEKNLNEEDGQNSDKIDVYESTQEYNEAYDCQDFESENEGSLKNGKAKSNKPEVQTPRNKNLKERNEGNQNERENVNNGMNVDSSRENPENRTQNIRKKRTLFQMENFVLQLEEGNRDARAKDGQNEETKLADMRSTRNSESRRTKNTAYSDDPVEEGKESKRKQRHSRTQSIDESLADEDHRNKISESPSTGSKPSSVVSETIFKSHAFKEMLKSPECGSKRRVQAIRKSVTKVATWLVNGDGIDDETSLIKRRSTEVLNDIPQEASSDRVAAPRNKNPKNDTSAAADIYYEENGRFYPIVDILQDRVLYYDRDSGSSGRLIKESYLCSCQLVIPKLNLTQSTDSVVTSERHKSTPCVSEPPAKDLDENNVRKQGEEVPSCAADCQDANEEDCGYGSHGVIGSSGSEDVFITPKLKDLMSYTNEPLPGNVNKPLVHAGKEMEDDESCVSTEILNSEKQANVNRRSSAKNVILLPDTHGATANETALEEGEDQVEESQELDEKSLEDDSASSSFENERRIGKETVDKGQVLDERILEGESASLQFENEGIICKETANQGQELDEQFLEADTNSPLKKEQMISEERVGHREKNSPEQLNVQDMEVADDFSTVTGDQTEHADLFSPWQKKKNKKKSRESISHEESITADSCDGSTLSQSAVKHTSSNENISQKDYMSKSRRKQHAGCSDEDKVKEDTEHSSDKGRKKKGNTKNIESKEEGISNSHFDEQTSEKNSEISTNEKELTREKSIQKHSAKLHNIQTAITEKKLSTNSPRKETSIEERFASAQTTAVLSERCTRSPRKETSCKERFASAQTTAVLPERCTSTPRKERFASAQTTAVLPERCTRTPRKERFASAQTTAVLRERCTRTPRKERFAGAQTTAVLRERCTSTPRKERFASAQTTAVLPERCTSTPRKERFASAQTTATHPEICTSSPRKETFIKEKFVSAQTTATLPERCTRSPRKETSIKEKFVSAQTTATLPERCTSSPHKETSFKERRANTVPSIPESSMTLPPEVTFHDENLTKEKSVKRKKKSNSKIEDISDETLPGGSPDFSVAVELQARGQNAVEVPGDVREQESFTEEISFEKKEEKKKKKYKERDKADVSAEETCEEKESIQGCDVDEGKTLSDSREARALSVERCTSSPRKETSIKEKFVSAQTTATLPERCSSSSRKETSIKEKFVSAQTTATLPERCTRSPRKETSIKEKFVSAQTTATLPERCTSSPHKETSFKERRANTVPSIPESSMTLPPEVTFYDENLTKEKSAKRKKKSNSKIEDISDETLPGGSPDFSVAVELQARGQNAVEVPGDVREQESFTEEISFEKKEEKKKKKKKKYKERDKADVSAEETCEEKESIQGCDVDEGKTLSDSREARALSVEDNCDKKKRKKEKKKRRDKGFGENEDEDVDEEDTTKKKEESEAAIKPVEQVYKPVLTRKVRESEKIDEKFVEPNATTKKSRKRSHKDSEIPSKPLAEDEPVLTSMKAKSDERATEGERTTEKTKKETKQKEKNENNKQKEDRHSEIDEEIPKKKRKKKRQECEEKATASQKGSCPDSCMFSSGSETEGNIPVTNVLSWISKKIKLETTEKSSTKKASKSTLMDLAQDDQELRLQKKPFHSSTPSFTSRSSSMGSGSRIFHKTPLGFTNTVPRIQEKVNFTPTTLASTRRKRKLSNSLPQRRELTQDEKDILSGGVKKLEELLDDDSVWD